MTDTANYDDHIQAFREAEKWLFSLITDPKGERYFQEKSMEVRMLEFREQIERMTSFLDFAGNPQTQFPSIHVAGTSGKGSVVQLLASILRSEGYRVGHHISPYLQVCLEKLIVEGKLIRPSEFAALVADFRTSFEAWTAGNEKFDTMKYGEAWVALTYLWLAKQQVDWGVIETGLGGRYDPTNVLLSRLAVITNINYDHVEVLGETLEEIAAHKAGIIKPGGLTITAETKPEALAVIHAEADQKSSQLLIKGRDFNLSIESDGSLTVNGVYQRYSGLRLSSKGEFQYENAALAVASLDLLAGLGMLEVSEEAVRKGLQAPVAGRFEIIQEHPLVILDGAHNQHKAQALAASLASAYPDQKLTLILGTLSIKDFSGMIKTLAPVTGKWIATQPKVYGKPAAPASALAEVIRKVTPEIEVNETDNVRTAIDTALAQAEEGEIIVVTGSLYLLGEARGVWRPVDRILEEIEQTGTSTLI
jgi:dihydrofolate synthase/folylpolyglutamate synthase